MISIDTEKKLRELGERLRDARLSRNEGQKRFAARLGISVPTLRKMEQGNPSCTIGNWLEALYMLDHLDDIDTLFIKKETLFDKKERLAVKKRQRASKRKTPTEK